MENIRAAAEGDGLAIARVHVSSWQTSFRGVVPDDILDGLDVVPGLCEYFNCPVLVQRNTLTQ